MKDVNGREMPPESLREKRHNEVIGKAIYHFTILGQ